MNQLEIRCQDCRRHLGLKGIESIICQIRCPNSKCKKLNNIKVVNASSSDYQLRYKFPEVQNV